MLLIDVTNTMRSVKHVKNCVLQNVFKIYNWWGGRNKKKCMKFKIKHEIF